jgi:hypothetical protein
MAILAPVERPLADFSAADICGGMAEGVLGGFVVEKLVMEVIGEEVVEVELMSDRELGADLELASEVVDF